MATASLLALGGRVENKVRLALAILLTCLALPLGHAQAQSFRLDRFRAAERPDDGFAARGVGSFAHLATSALVTADYAHDPLVLESKGGARRETARIVRHELTLSVDLALSLYERVIVFAKLDLVPLLKGPPVDPALGLARAEGGDLGDLSLGARVRLVGEEDDLFALALQAALIAPTGRERAYVGEDGVAGRPELIAELRPRFVRIRANLGSTIRREQRLVDTRIGSELVWALGLALPVHRMVDLIGELWGGFAYSEFARRATTPFEWLLGAKLHTEAGLYAGLGAGTGFTHGVGTPDARAVAQLGFLPRRKRAEPKAVPPPSDRDQDGVADLLDRCPDVPEDRNGVADEDGCPEADRDGDGVLDIDDRCPDEKEDRDGVDDEDGCPDPDNDKDGVLDVEDACPRVAGVPEERGCAPKPRFSEEGQLIVLDQILFETNKAVILPESIPHLEAVQTLLRERPEITKMRIEGHTDSTGPDPRNQLLSEQRAAAVRKWLIDHGVAPGHLVGYGCGEKHPVASDETPEGRAQNRRVVFQVVEPADDAARREAPAGCVRTKE